MATKFIDGVGLVTVSSKKSKEEVDLTMDYYENIAPRYQELGGFAAGFNDTESIIYRWWENIHKTDDEEKDTWFKEQMSQWGKMVGYTDSQALLKFYNDIEKIRPLNAEEQADIEANHTSMKNFEADMYDAYDNHSGDISDVQKKYGYDEEELGVMKGLWEFGKLAATNPRYMLGSLAGMVVKDPELLLLGFLRIPSLAGQGAARSAQMLQKTRLAQQAIKIQPKYVQGLARAMQSNRGKAVVGRAAEGATYAGTYEALHDLTFNGHIKKENIERGLALGALLGSAFGAITKSTGANSWLLSKQGSINAEKKLALLKNTGEELKWREIKNPAGETVDALGWSVGWQKRMHAVQDRIHSGWTYNKNTKVWELPVKPEEAKPVDALSLETKNIDFRAVPNKAKLPEGLTHGARYKLWKDRAVQVWKRGEETVGDAEAVIDGHINSRKSKLLLERNKDGVAKYTNEEASGIAAKEVARDLEKLNPEFIKVEAKGLPKDQRPVKPSNKKWGNNREKALGLENLTEVRPRSSFKDLFKPRHEDLPIPTGKQLTKAGVIGGAAGYYILEDDKTLGGILGITGAVLARRQLRGINRSKAMMKLKLYGTMAGSEGVRNVLQAETGKTLNVLAQVLKGKHPTISNIQFLTYLENFSKKSKVVDGIDYGIQGRRKLPEKVQEALEAYTKLMETFRRAGIEAGVLDSEQFILDYVTHIYRRGKKPLTEAESSAFQKRLKDKGSDFTDFSSFGKQRKIVEDIMEIAKSENIETDVFAILDAYSRSMSKAIAGAQTIKVLQQNAVLYGNNAFSVIIKEGEMNRILKIDGKSWKMKDYAREKLGYETSNHPALRDKLVHPLMKNALDDFFTPELQTEGLLNKTIIVNNALKRLAVSFSFFHAQALVLSGAYSGVLGELATSAGRARLKEIRKMMRGEWVSYGKDKFGNPITKKNIHGEEVTGEIYGIEGVKEMADAGVGLGMKANEFVDAGYNTVKALMDKHAPLASKIQGSIDKWTWDKTHDVSKAFVYFTMKQRMMSTKPRGVGKIMPFLGRMRGKDLGKWEALSEAEAREISASFVNDAFGGQRHAKLAMEWQKKAIENANNPKGQMYQWLALWTTPTKAKLSNLALFSPDWTVSNLRIGFRGMGISKDLFGKIVKGEKFTPREMAEWNLYMGYWVRALASTSLGAMILHDMLTDEDDHDYKPFDFNEFWYTGRLNIGGGEEIVVSKQIAEPLHWLANPMHTFLNKTAAAPKIGMEAIMGREWVSMKHGDSDRLFFRGGRVTGRYLDKGDPKQMAWWAGNKFTPISFNKITRAIRQGEDWKEEVVPSMFGGVGFPTYQRPLEK